LITVVVVLILTASIDHLKGLKRLLQRCYYLLRMIINGASTILCLGYQVI
jgi:hypothetical protein